MLRLGGVRLLAIGGLALVAFLYWKPAHAYLKAKRELESSQADVRSLREERARLQKQIAQAGTGEQFAREARTLGLVKPGEKLFIVNGIAAWEKKHQKH
jgi:cell division protein FtsB